MRELSDLAEILRLHDEAFRDYIERFNDGHKSSEGAVELTFGNFWDRGGWDTPGAPGSVGVSIYSYALGPNRMHYFDSIAEGLAAMRKWHRAEMGRQS
jgi:hypothetical protein